MKKLVLMAVLACLLWATPKTNAGIDPNTTAIVIPVLTNLYPDCNTNAEDVQQAVAAVNEIFRKNGLKVKLVVVDTHTVDPNTAATTARAAEPLATGN